MTNLLDWLLGQGGQTFGGATYGGNKFGGQKFGESADAGSTVEGSPVVAPAPAPAPEPAPAPAGPSPFGNMKFGGNTFGGNTFGGQTFGGNKFGGNTFGASAPPPAGPAPGTMPPPPNAADLPSISGIIQGIKNQPPAPVTPAAVAAQVPPQGDNVPPMPAPQEVAANAPAATGEPTPLAPDASAGPAAPSDTPAGRSLLDRIMGSDDPSTKDSAGLTQADRHATGFDALAKLGFGIMAASMPQNPGQRAQTIAQLGSIPADMLKQRAALIGQQAQAQQVQMRQKQLDDSKRARQVLDSPEFAESFKTMPPQMQAVAKAAAAAGDIATIAKLQQAYMPKMSGNTVFDPRTGQFTNTLTGQTGGPGGASAPGAGGAAPGQPNEEGYHPEALQGVNPTIAAAAQQVAEGKAKFPTLTDRNGMGAAILQAAKAYNPKLDGTTFDRRQRAEKDLTPNGTTGGQMVSMNTLLQHTNDLRQAADNLDNTNVPIWNTIKNTYNSAVGASPQDRFNTVQGLATKELDTLISKNHATIAETAHIRENINAAKSPEQLQAVIDEMTSLAKARIQSVTKQATNALGKKGFADIAEQLQNPEGLKALYEIEANPLKGSDKFKAHAAIRQQFGLPADADVAHYEYRRAPDGTVQRKKK